MRKVVSKTNREKVQIPIVENHARFTQRELKHLSTFRKEINRDSVVSARESGAGNFYMLCKTSQEA